VTIEGPDAGSDPEIGGLFAQLGQMQQHLQAAQEMATSTVIEGSAGGGAVTVTGTGGLDVSAVTIDPKIVDPADVDMLEDLVLAAIRNLIEQAQALQSQAMGGLDLGGGLEGLLGG
jgi:DNA-binding YbaB/EbfC family protein